MTYPSLVLEAATVTVAASPGVQARTLLHPTDVTLRERRIALIGANGQGKTTLMRALAHLSPLHGGRVLVDGIDPALDAAGVRQRLGFLFADTAAQLIMPTVVEDVELSLRRRAMNRKERRAAALALLEAQELGHLAERSVFDLSGGERQLVALTGVLATEPSWVLADEPTAALDLVNRHRVVRALTHAPARLLVATHDLELASTCERALWVHDGQVVADGDPAELIAAYIAAAEGKTPWPAREETPS
ncbi:energy-coupling factor ABC transporter ATP-binding protein [Galactobacter caseinivorans]|uniref:energy-coupling factor ABC transporter ATP-binding protein n=1 Tax=Galactobacter caseinivorans TaxID=2676123 RepID=UPI0018F75043|nr:ABC transporter ATP-binding protein [Galactobacter caseinivorans]